MQSITISFKENIIMNFSPMKNEITKIFLALQSEDDTSWKHYVVTRKWETRPGLRVKETLEKSQQSRKLITDLFWNQNVSWPLTQKRKVSSTETIKCAAWFKSSTMNGSVPCFWPYPLVLTGHRKHSKISKNPIVLFIKLSGYLNSHRYLLNANRKIAIPKMVQKLV